VLLRTRLPSEVAVAVAERGVGGPVQFLRPLGNLTLAGTAHVPWTGGSLPPSPPGPEELAAFLEGLSRAVPDFRPDPRDVIRVAWGLLPATRVGSATPAKHPVIVDHGRRGGPRGLVSVSGVKFTTAPIVALATLRAAGVSAPRGSALGSEVLADVRLVTRPRVPAPAPGDDMTAFLAKWRYEIGAMAREESAFRVEDVICRRLDWNLADLDLTTAGKDIHWAFPELAAGPLPSRPH
jgi:hypothetical protein